MRTRQRGDHHLFLLSPYFLFSSRRPAMEGLDHRIFLEQTCKYAPLPTTDMRTPGTAPSYKARLRPYDIRHEAHTKRAGPFSIQSGNKRLLSFSLTNTVAGQGCSFLSLLPPKISVCGQSNSAKDSFSLRRYTAKAPGFGRVPPGM